MMEHVLLGLLSCSLMVVQPASSFPHPSLQLALKCQAISEYFDSVTGSCEPCREICELAHITRTQQECETQCGGECHGELLSSQLSTCLSHSPSTGQVQLLIFDFQTCFVVLFGLS